MKAIKIAVGVVLVAWGLFGSWQCIQETRVERMREKVRAELHRRKRIAAEARWESLGVILPDELFKGISDADTIGLQRALQTDQPILMCGSQIVSSFIDSTTAVPTYRVRDNSTFRVIWVVSSEVELGEANRPFTPLRGCYIFRVAGLAEASNAELLGEITVPVKTDGKRYSELEPPTDI